MAGSVVGPMVIGAASAALGAGVTLWAGGPWPAAVAAYALTGAAGLLAGAWLNFRAEAARHETAAPRETRALGAARRARI